jgi:DNA-binding LytR/AlgR family response regulator
VTGKRSAYPFPAWTCSKAVRIHRVFFRIPLSSDAKRAFQKAAQAQSARLLRIHCSAIVNVHRIREIQPWFHGYHLIILERMAKELRMSRYQRDVAERFGLALIFRSG